MGTTSAELALIVTDIGFILNALAIGGVGLFVLSQAPKKLTNRIFFLFSLTASLFFLSHVAGSNIADPNFSRAIFMLNLVTLINAPLAAHFAFSVVGIHEKEKIMLRILYSVAFALISFFIAFPNAFLLPSEPKLYFPNFYVQGKLYFLGDLFFYLTILYMFAKTLLAYRKADIVLKTRIKYLLFGLFSGYLLALIPALPLYNVNVDPILSAFVWLPYIPLAYAVVKQDLLDIHIVAKQALIYSLIVAAVGIVIGSLMYINLFLVTHGSPLPNWMLPLLTAFIGVEASRLIWKRLKQSEEIRHEFINVVTHKFRTPLTYIKWSLDILKVKKSAEEEKKSLAAIENAQEKLTELTEMLVAAASTDDRASQYVLEKINLGDVVSGLTQGLNERIKEKRLHLSIDTARSAWIMGDRKRIEFAIQTLLENSVVYTPPEGRIAVRVTSTPALAILVIEDTGIGIGKEDTPHIFQKFYRSAEATVAHTEGMGIGLFTAKTIIDRHGGKISVKSEGMNQGTAVTATFKAIKSE